MATYIATDRLTVTDVHTIVEHCLAHGDEALPRGVLALATSNQLDRVASMLDAGALMRMRDLGLFVWVSCGDGV